MRFSPALVVFLAGLAFPIHAADLPAEAAKGFQPLTAALHVHSRFSNGVYDIRELTAMARQRGVDVLGITDSFLTRVRYGVPPFRRALSKARSRPGVLDHGVDAYLDAIAEAQRNSRDLVVLPGVEVAPYYYWRGSWPANLSLLDFDRHLLVFGLPDRDAVRNLPVIENERWSNTQREWWSAAGPAVVWLVGFLFLAVGMASRNRRMYRLAVVVFLIAGVWTYDAYPFAPVPDPYSGKPDPQAFQRVIDYVDGKGGVAFWSYPEAKYPDVQMSGATMISKGQPQLLGLTENYRGFEGLYGDKISVTGAGGLWDQLLMDYLRGGRRSWASVITGIDFHSFQSGNRWYDLNGGLTVLFAKEKTAGAAMDSLKHGRGYATFQNSAGHLLLLEDFAVRSGSEFAIAGETVKSGGEVEVTGNLRWLPGAGLKPADEVAKVTVVEDGGVIDQESVSLPWSFHRALGDGVGRHYVRVMAQSGATTIVSNPIFWGR